MSVYRFAGWVLVLAMTGCANPMPPSGGPPDSTPPMLVSSSPEQAATLVTEPEITLTFSEPVDAASFARALTLIPEPERPLTFEWRRTTVRIPLESLRENTTYVLTLDTQLRDQRGVPLREPLSLAFSTGVSLDTLAISGMVLDAALGQPAAGIDVYAWRSADVHEGLPPRPAYRTQTRPDGTFRLAYLNEGPFFVVAVRDVNRNRRIDAGEAVAPPPYASITPDSAEVDRPWLIALSDTTGPRATRIRALSSTRLALTFDRSVVWADSAQWAVRDTLGPTFPRVDAFRSPTESREVILRLPTPMATRVHTVHLPALRDSLDRSTPPSRLRVNGSSAADTVQVRLLRLAPVAERDSTVELLFSDPPSALFREQLSVQDTTGNAQPFTLDVRDPIRWALRTSLPALLLPGEPFAGQDSARAIPLRPLDPRTLGRISGRVAYSGESPVWVVLTDGMGQARRRRAARDGTFAFEALPEGAYRLEAFEDLEGAGRWFSGRVLPWQQPARRAWYPGVVNVRPRWTTELEAPISLP